MVTTVVGVLAMLQAFCPYWTYKYPEYPQEVPQEFSDDPDLISADVCGVSSELNAVIDGGSAGRSKDDSSSVVLPGCSINANGDWSSGLDVSEHSCLVSSSDVAPSADSCSDGAWAVVARSILAGVWVGSIGVNSSSSLDVCVCEIGPSSVASVASGIAINDLLHGESSCNSS